MEQTDEVLMEKLKKEAEEWVELELEARMAAAEEEIGTQVDVGANLYDDATLEAHSKKAKAYAEQEMRKELEIQAQKWIEEEYKKRKAQG